MENACVDGGMIGKFLLLFLERKYCCDMQRVQDTTMEEIIEIESQCMREFLCMRSLYWQVTDTHMGLAPSTSPPASSSRASDSSSPHQYTTRTLPPARTAQHPLSQANLTMSTPSSFRHGGEGTGMGKSDPSTSNDLDQHRWRTRLLRLNFPSSPDPQQGDPL